MKYLLVVFLLAGVAYAETPQVAPPNTGYEVKIPANLSTDESKLAFILRVDEMLIQEFNDMGRKLRANKITQEEFNQYKLEFFKRKSEVSWQRHILQEKLRNKTTVNPNLNNVIKKKIIATTNISTN